MNKDNAKVNSYIAEIVRFVTELNPKADIASDIVTKVVMPGKYGSIIALLQFYRSSVRVLLIHPSMVPQEHRKKVTARLDKLNSQLESGDYYGIGDKSNGLVFHATYALRKRDASDDAGLHGFCTLIFVTAPERLDQTAAHLQKLRVDNEPELFRTSLDSRSEMALK